MPHRRRQRAAAHIDPASLRRARELIDELVDTLEETSTVIRTLEAQVSPPAEDNDNRA